MVDYTLRKSTKALPDQQHQCRRFGNLRLDQHAGAGAGADRAPVRRANIALRSANPSRTNSKEALLSADAIRSSIDGELPEIRIVY